MDWPSLGIGVLASIIAAAIVYFIAWSKGYVSGSWILFLCLVKLQKRLKSAGLTNFFSSRSDFGRYRGAPRLIDYLSLAKESVDVAAYWMAHGNEAEGIADGIAKLVQPPQKIKVTIAIIDPTAIYIDELASYLNIEAKELKLRIESSLNNLYKAREKLSIEEKNRFRIKVYKTIPIASVIMIDGETNYGRIQLDFRPYKVPRHYSFAFEFSGRGNYLYDLCRNAWKKLIDDASDYEPSKKVMESVQDSKSI